MKYYLHKFEPEHLDMIAQKSVEVISAQGIDLEKLKVRYSSGLGYSLFCEDGTIIGCGGSLKKKNGEVELWLILSSIVRHHMKIAVRVIKGIIMAVRMIEKDRGGKIITADVRDDFPLGAKFAERMGMKNTGLIKENTKTGRRYKLFRMEV